MRSRQTTTNDDEDDAGTNLINQRRIRRGILRLQALDGIHITSVRDNNGVLFELIELGRHDGNWQRLKFWFFKTAFSDIMSVASTV